MHLKASVGDTNGYKMSSNAPSCKAAYKKGCSQIHAEPMLYAWAAQAAAQAYMAMQFNSGQVCTAGTRTFVHEAIYDEACPHACLLSTSLHMNPAITPRWTSARHAHVDMTQNEFQKGHTVSSCPAPNQYERWPPININQRWLPIKLTTWQNWCATHSVLRCDLRSLYGLNTAGVPDRSILNIVTGL